MTRSRSNWLLLWTALAALLFVVWVAPTQVAAEPARCNAFAPPNGNALGNVNCNNPALGVPPGFQAPHNPTANKCSGIVDPSKGCWEEPFYPGGPAAGPLREAWKDACLITSATNTTNMMAGFTVAADQHTKIACCNSSTNTCSKIPADMPPNPQGASSSNPADCPAAFPQAFACPFTAVSATLLTNPSSGSKPQRTRILFWTGIDGIEQQTVSSFGQEAEEIDSPWRVLDLTNGAPGVMDVTFHRTFDQTKKQFVILPDDTGGGGDRFCAQQTTLPSGQVMTAGGTRWTAELPSSDVIFAGFPLQLELEGLQTTTIYDGAANLTFTVDSMLDGRWYMSMTPLGSGSVLGGAGISTLTLFETHRDTWEVFDKTFTWTMFPGTDTLNPGCGQSPVVNMGTAPCRLLPLMSRLQLLPNGEVFYPAVGQLWGPFGEHPVGAATWHMTFAACPPGESCPDPGAWRPTGDMSTTARTGAQVLMRPLTAPYDTATVVAMSGIQVPAAVLGDNDFGASGAHPTAATPTIEVMHISASSMVPATVARTTSVGALPGTCVAGGCSLNEPLGRWFSTGVILPDRSNMMIGGGTKSAVPIPGCAQGSNADEVVLPGCEAPLFTTERSRDGGLSDPWQFTAIAHRPRTYHNTAGVLLPDGRVVSSGHRPIPKNYGGSPVEDSDQHAAPATSYQHGRDLMWEIYKPGYLIKGDGSPSPRPFLTTPKKTRLTYGQTLCVKVSKTNMANSVSGQLMRPTAVTHVEQHEQRMVVLETGTCGSQGVGLTMPPNGNVAPPGWYMLSVLEENANPTNPLWKDVPSEARFMQLCRTSTGPCAGP